MSINIKVAKLIDRPVDKVFHFYAHEHVRNHPRWDPDMHLEKITDGPTGVGTVIRRRVSRTFPPVKGKMEIVEFEENKSMRALIQDGPTTTRGLVTFQAESKDQTSITFDISFEDMDETMAPTIKGLLERSLKNIKQLVESET